MLSTKSNLSLTKKEQSMKKIIIGAAIALVMSTSLFANTWTNNIGLGFSVPVTNYKAKDSIFYDTATTSTDKKTEVAFDIQGMYLGYHQNGFTVKGALSLGIGTISDLYPENGSLERGIGVNIVETLGIGYSFIRSDKAVLALTAGIGLQEGIYPRKVKIALLNSSEEHDVTDTFFTFNLGADLTAVIRSSDKFGFYASLYAGWIPTGFVKSEDKVEVTKNGTTSSTTESLTKDLDGTFFFAPTIGVVWTF